MNLNYIKKIENQCPEIEKENILETEKGIHGIYIY